MDKIYLPSTLLVIRSLEVNKDPFHPQEEGEPLLGPEVPYMSGIGALMYLANCTQPDIAFSANLLAKYRFPTLGSWVVGILSQKDLSLYDLRVQLKGIGMELSILYAIYEAQWT